MTARAIVPVGMGFTMLALVRIVILTIMREALAATVAKFVAGTRKA